MSTLTDKLPKISTDKLPIDLDDAKKPAFAAVGVVDLYVEQVKDLPAEAKKVQAKLQAKIETARVARTAQLKTVPAQIKSLPTQVKEFRTELEGRVAKVTSYYGKLAVRGEKLVGQIRRQPSTEAALAEGKAAVKKAEAAANNAKRSVKAGEKAVEDAAAKIG